ncbi:MAG: ribosome biogenesis GTPase YlqF [Ruminiclostridium sp.]
MAYEGNIQWFPGHMTKTRRMIEADIKLVDAVVEIVDSRIPESSRNPVLSELVGSKPRIIMLNKCDYADDNITRQWKSFYEKQGYSVMICDCRSGKGIKQFTPMLKNILADLLEKRRAKGMIGKALRIMVVGIPNVGKSSFINRMANSKKTLVGDRPGVTRGKQWVTIDKEVELLDMPGILWPKFDDQSVAVKLAFTGAIKDDVMDVESLATHLGEYLAENYPEKLKERYKLTDFEGNILELIAKKRGMMISGGEPDTERAAITLLDEFRGGKIGKITLERPKA